MEEKTKRLQAQLISDIDHTMSILSAAKDLVMYLNMKPRFFYELELTSSTLQELSKRVYKIPGPQHILSARQVKMMATDLLNDCKKNMCAA